jgi:hypothetical protein
MDQEKNIQSKSALAFNCLLNFQGIGVMDDAKDA